MKTVVISRDEKELARIPLARKSLLAGRSPSCDAVVRSKGIKPVQFMIEHVSENLSEEEVKHPNLDEGFWTLIDISEHTGLEAEKRASSTGTGIVLDENLQSFNGFDFKIVIDSLHETDIKKGVLARSLSNVSTTEISDKPASVLEVVHFKKDLDIVTNIVHLNKKRTPTKIKFLQQMPNFILEWDKSNDESTAKLVAEKSDKVFEVFKKGERITEDFIDAKPVLISNQDLIHVETEEYDYFIRLVPEITVDLEKLSWVKDYLIQTSMVIFGAITMLIVLLSFISQPEEKITEPPRIIKLELHAPPPPKPEPVPPEEVVLVEAKKDVVVAPKEKEVIEKPQKVIEEKPIQKNNDIAVKPVPKKEVVAATDTKVINRPNEQKKIGLNNNAKPKDVNTIGLLAKLKNGQTPTKQKVSADTILNQGVVSETVTGATGKVVINKAPSGTIGKQDTPVNPNALAEASTTLSGASVANSKSSGPLAVNGGKNRFSTGTQLSGSEGIGGGAGTDAGHGSNGVSGLDVEASLQVAGGLDKDAIRKALRENRRAIANCYENALLTKRQLNGRMTFRWTIAVEGDVKTIKLQSSEIGMPNFESCVENVIKTIKFPQAPNKQMTTVIYPFAFQGKK